MHRLSRCFLVACLVSVVLSPHVWAWGPHPVITKAALDVLPEMDRWKQLLGADNIAAFTNYCWLPDMQGQDAGSFYADDYLVTRALPRYVGHTMPTVQETWAPCFRRAIQALRTETPVNACRQIGPLLHWVEDSGAPPHAKPNCPHHSELENWVDATNIKIPDYQPKLFGATDDEALQGFLQRMKGLVAFSAERADRALPLVSQPTPDRAQVEPIILESALESARVAADVLYTVFTLGLAPQPAGATLTGTVTAPVFPLHSDSSDPEVRKVRNAHGARIVLLDTDYATLATTLSPQPEGPDWKGVYEFRHLPAGTYRVLAYRTAAQAQFSAPITLRVGEVTKLDFTLAPTDPTGNIIENPDGRLAYLPNGLPDRWRLLAKAPAQVWGSAAARTIPGMTYRCGAVLKDPGARVRFVFQAALGVKDVAPIVSNTCHKPLIPDAAADLCGAPTTCSQTAA